MSLQSVLSKKLRVGAGRLAAVLVATLALAACATTGGEGDRTSGDDSSLTIATSFSFDDLDPMTNAFWGPEFGYVELLMRPERNGAPSPWVLQELSATNDTTWKLTLRDGVKFENGRALDAEALAQLLTYTAQNNESFASASAFGSAVPDGPSAVTLTTTKPVPTLPNVLADEAMVPVFDVSAYEAYKQAGSEPSALLEAGLYTGPYVVQSLNAQEADLAPFPDHWSGGPALDGIKVRFIPEATSRVQAVKTGEADMALYMPTAIARTLDDSGPAYWVTGEPAGSTFSFTMNTRRPGFDDPRVRRAIYSAVDYRALAEDVLSGQADVATSVFSPRLPYAVDTQKTDLALSRQLLEEAGWTLGPDGKRSRNGQTLTMRLLSYPQQPDSTTLAEALQSQLGEVGVTVEVHQVDDITAEREAGNWDGAIVGDSLISFGGSPVEGLAGTFQTGSEENYQGISDPQLDAAISTLQTTFDEVQREALLKDLQQIIAENGYWGATVMRRPGIVTNEAWTGYETPISNMWVTADTAPKG